jgi:uncharacterized damage-inducible protein DinB
VNRTLAALFLLATASACAPAPPPPPPPPPPSTAITDSTKVLFDAVKGYLTRAVEQAPENRLGYQPTKDVRTLGQLFAHVADANYMFCSLASGEAGPAGSAEQTAKTKAEIQKALADSFAFCDRAFAAVNDTTGGAEVTIAAINNMKTTKLGVLVFATAHANEHYGNVVTYFRLNKMVPPSSQPAAGGA